MTNTSNTPNISAAQRIQAKISRIFQLQALPDNVMRIMEKLRNANSTAEDVGKEIAKDPAFSAQVLKLVNSGFYGFSYSVRSVSHATVLLGFSVMNTLVLSASILGNIPQAASGLWRHSLACARTCVLLARRLGLKDPEEYSTIGLLHDIGKIVLFQYFKEDFDAVSATVKSENILFHEAEIRVLGIKHTDIARWLLDRWRLPPETTVPIVGHHAFQPETPEAQRIAIVHLADIMVRAAGVGSGGDDKIPALNLNAARVLELEPRHLQGLMDEMMVELYDMS